MAAFDITSPEQMGHVVRRMSNFAAALPEHIVEAGKSWYPEAHDFSMRTGREYGHSTETTAGVIAALSGQSKWDLNKRAAVDLLRMTPEHRNIMNRALVLGRGEDELKDMFTEHYPGLVQSTGSNIRRAAEIQQGAKPETILQFRNAPKYHSFYRNIANPEGDEVTLDFRAFDLLSNQMQSVRDFDRRIDTGELIKKGRNPYRPELTRYQRLSDVYRDTARGSRGRFPIANQLQASTWLAGQEIELSPPLSKPGKKREKGKPRKGQPYMDETGKPIDYGELNWGDY